MMSQPRRRVGYFPRRAKREAQAVITPPAVGMRINPDIITGLMYERTRMITADEAWRMYAPPRTLGATEADTVAMDNHLQRCGYHGLIAHAINLGMGLEEIAPQFLGYPYLAGLSQNGLIRAGVCTIAEEMTKKWIEIKRGEESAEDDDRVKTLMSALNDFGIPKLFNEAAEKCDFDGGCLIFIDTGEEDKALEEPLHADPALFSGKRIKRFTLVEAINLYPGLYNATDPLAPDYFTPTHWLVLGKRIHRSRLLYFAPNKVNLLLRPAYNFFGIPASQLCLDYVAHFTKTREAAQRLLTKFSLTVFKSDMSAILGGGGADNFDRRMAYLTQWRDNDMILAIDMEREDVVKLETPISGVTDIVRQSLEFVSMVFRMPVTKFLGISPAGMNATGESDMRNFYDHVESKQEKVLRRPLDKVLDLLQLHLFGEIDPEIKAVFCPLSDEDDSQKAMTQKTKMDTLAVAVQSAIVSEEEARQAIVDDPDSPLNFITPDEVPEAPGGMGEEEFAGGLEAGEGYNAASDSEKATGVLQRLRKLLGGKKKDPQLSNDEFSEQNVQRDDEGKFSSTGGASGSGESSSSSAEPKTGAEAFKEAYDASTLPEEVQASITEYTEVDSEMYVDLNNRLRESEQLTDDQIDVVDNIDKAFELATPVENDFITHKGVQDFRFLEDVEPGGTYTDDAFISTAPFENDAENFADPTYGGVIDIVVPKGAKALNVSEISDAIESGREDEILLPRGSKFRLVEKWDGGARVELVLD